MSAATAGRITEEKILGRFSAPVAASTTIYAGTLVALDSNGRVVPVTGTTGLRAVGRACTRGGLDRWDNASGAAAAFDVEIEEGIFFWDNSSAGEAIAQAQVGTICYGVDDQTVGKTGASGTLSVAGVVRYIDSSLGVAVESSLALSRALIAESNPSGIAFTQTYSTASATVAAVTSHAITDSSGGTPSTTVLAAQGVTVTAAAPDTAGGGTPSATQVDTGINTALALLITNINAELVIIRNNIATANAELTLVKADLLSMKQNDNKVIDALQASGIAS